MIKDFFNKTHKAWLYPVILFVSAFILYGNTIPNQYSLDDDFVIHGNAQVQKGIRGIPDIFTSRYSDKERSVFGYRPVVKSSFAIEFSVFGENPHISHLINVILYAFSGILLLFILKKWYSRYGWHQDMAFLTVLLFMAHPVHTEVVASLKNREDLLCFIFCLISLQFFFSYYASRKLYYLISGILLFMLALLTKQNAVAFAIIIPLALYFFTDFKRSPQGESAQPYFAGKSDKHFSVAASHRWFLRFYSIICFLFLSFYVFIKLGLKGLINPLQYYPETVINFMLLLLLLYGSFILIYRRWKFRKDCNKYLRIALTLNFVLPLTAVVYMLLLPYLNKTGMGWADINNLKQYSAWVSIVFFSPIIISYLIFQLRKKQNGSHDPAADLTLHLLFAAAFFIFIQKPAQPYYTAGRLALLLFPLIVNLIYLRYRKATLSGKDILWVKKLSAFGSLTRRFLNVFSIIFISAIILGVTAYSTLVAPEKLLPETAAETGKWQNPLYVDFSPASRISQGFGTLFFYLKIQAIPHPLLYYYGYNMFPGWSKINALTVFSILIHLFLAALAILFFNRKHILSFAIFYYLSNIIIFSNFIMPLPGIVAERLVFMGSLGFCMAVAYLLFRIFRISLSSGVFQKKNLLFLSFITIVLLSSTAATIFRNTAWKDHFTLFSRDMPYLKNSSRANILYADQLLRQITKRGSGYSQKEKMRLMDSVATHYSRALSIDPENPNAWNNLGYVYANYLGKFNDAVNCFTEATRRDKGYYEAFSNLGYAYSRVNLTDSAVVSYHRAIKIKSDYTPARSRLFELLFQLPDYARALEEARNHIVADGQSEAAYINAGNASLMLGDTAGAMTYWESALHINPGNTTAYENLSNYYRIKGNYQKVKDIESIKSGRH